MCDLYQQTVVWQESGDKRLAQIMKKMPTIGNLHGIRSACLSCLGILTGTIPANNLCPGMSSEPLCSALRAAVR